MECVQQSETKKQTAARLERERAARNPMLFDVSVTIEESYSRTEFECDRNPPQAYAVTAPEIDPPGAARIEDPDTAKDAASSVHAREIENKVLAAIAHAVDGLTSEECATVLGLALVTVSPRMRPLERQGKIFESTDRRKNKSGSSAIVWKVGKSVKRNLGIL